MHHVPSTLHSLSFLIITLRNLLVRKKVHELHRLYRVQKQLVSGGPRGRRLWRRHPRRPLDLHLPADEYIGGGGAGHGTPPSCREDELLELTLAVGGRRKRRDDDLASSGSGGARSPSSSSSNGSPYQTAVAKQQQQAP
jgi:hypothetical protein